ncbi:hypothetical protein Ndes2526B_g01786 [Nannochloris sp. 'desiccata']
MTRYRTHITEECVVPVPAAKKALQKHIVKSSGLPLSIYARLKANKGQERLCKGFQYFSTLLNKNVRTRFALNNSNSAQRRIKIELPYKRSKLRLMALLVDSRIPLPGPQMRALGKRKRENAPTTSAQPLLAPPQGALTLLQFNIEENSVEDGRIHFDREFIKQVVTDSLGLSGRLKTALSFSIFSLGDCPYEKSKPAKLKFNGSSNHGGYLKLGSNFIKQLNLQPGGVLKMEYRYWQSCGGGKNGKDPVYYFTLESAGLSSTGGSGEASMQIEVNFNRKRSFEGDSQERGTTSCEKPKHPSRSTTSTIDRAAADALASMAKAQATSFKSAPNVDAPPRHRAPLVSTGIRNINELSNHYTSDIAKEMEKLTPPDPDCPSMWTHTITSGLDRPRLGLKLAFIRPLLEETLGITYTKNLLLKVRILIEGKGCESVFERAIVSTKQNYLSQWRKIRSLLGGADFGDDLIFMYKGKVQEESGYVYYFALKKQSNSGTDDKIEKPDATEDLDAAEEKESEQSMGDLMKELEEWNKKYEESPAIPLPPVAPIRRPDGPEPLKSRPIVFIQDARLLRADSRSTSPSLAPTEIEEEAEEVEAASEMEALQPRKMLLERLKPSKVPDLQREAKPLSVLQTCANEINALEAFVSSVKASATADTAKSKGDSLLNMHRHRLAQHFVDSGVASELGNHHGGAFNVFMDLKSGLLSHFKYKEQSFWYRDYIGKLKKPLLTDLEHHGASISHSLERVLMGQWPFKVWVGDMNNRDLLPAGVGVVALEDIPAGSCVTQFIGHYISSGELPAPSIRIYDAYREEEAELEHFKEEEEEEDGGCTCGGNGDLMQKHRKTSSFGCPDEMNEEIKEANVAVKVSKSTKTLWLGNISRNCTQYDIFKLFSKYGEVVRLKLVNHSKQRPYAFIYFKTASAGEDAFEDLEGAILPSITGEKPLVLSYQKGSDEKKYDRGSTRARGHDEDDLTKGFMYYRSRHSEATKRYCVHMARGTECVVPAAAAKTKRQKKVVNGSIPPHGSNIPTNNDQWRRLESTIITARHGGNATYFMRPSEKNFNLSRVQLNVPNGPTKILYYAKRNIVKGEELVRER